MNPDAPVCLCFHVSRRKIERFIRIEKPQRASQLSECFGAGTGCGWCRPYLERLMQQHSTDPTTADNAFADITPEQYAQAREEYRAQKRLDAE